MIEKLFLILSLVGESHGYVHVPCHLVGNELREAYNLSSVPLGTSIRHVPVCQPSFEGQERRVRAIDLFATRQFEKIRGKFVLLTIIFCWHKIDSLVHFIQDNPVQGAALHSILSTCITVSGVPFALVDLAAAWVCARYVLPFEHLQCG